MKKIQFLTTVFCTLLMSGTLWGQNGPNCFLEDFEPKDAVIPAAVNYPRTTAVPTATVTIDYTDTLSWISKYIFGNAIAVWVSPDINNPTVIGQLQELLPTLIRFPGGSWSNIYFWNGNPGDLPQTVPNSEGVMEQFYPQFGPQLATTFDRYMDMRDQIESQGLITINYGYARYGLSERPAEQAAHLAAEWVREDNGRTKFWEIGNENAGPWEAGWRINTSTNQDGQPEIITGELYGQHFRIFADSMRKAATETGAEIYIGAQIIHYDATGSWNEVEWDWNESVFAEVGDAADFYVIHNYFGGGSTPGSYLDNIITTINDMHEFILQDIDDKDAAPRPVALTEWNMDDNDGNVKTSIINGLQGVLGMSEMAKLGYGMSCRWLLANWNTDGMFYHGDNSSIPAWSPRPAFFYLYYLQKYMGSFFLNSEVSGSDNIKVYPTLFNTGEIGVVVVNKGETDEAVKIDLSNTNYGNKLYYYSLTGGNDDSDYSKMVYVNDSGPDPNRWGPLENLETIEARSDTLLYPIKINSPRFSVQYILIQAGDSIMHQVDVDSMRIADSGETLSITEDNGTLQLVAEVFPWNATDNGVTWATSDLSVAVVDHLGEVTAIYNGDVYIRATTSDGGFTDSVQVSVSNQRYEVTGISLTTETGTRTINTPGGTLQIVAVIEPEYAEDKTVTWSVNDTNIAVIDSEGLLTARGNGSSMVTCIANDGGLSATISIAISNQPTSLQDFDLSSLKVYPVPAKDILYIENNSQVICYEILTIEGKVLKTINHPALKTEVDIKNLAPGIYLIRAKNESGSRVVRFVR